MQTVLANARKSDIVPEPFPHLVIRGALDDEIGNRLVEEFPPLSVVTQDNPYKSNQLFCCSAAAVIRRSSFSPLWKQLVAAHVTQDFLQQVLSLFQESMVALYPSFEREIGCFSSLRAGIRNVDTFDTVDVLLDARICINTPVKDRPTSVRGGHLDKPQKLFTGLLYLPHPEDNATGGELELYRYKTEKPVFEKDDIDSSYIEKIQTIPYEKNTLVFFVNSSNSLHGVSIRDCTPWPRQFVTLFGVVRQPLFSLDRYRRKSIASVLKRILRLHWT